MMTEDEYIERMDDIHRQEYSEYGKATLTLFEKLFLEKFDLFIDLVESSLRDLQEHGKL